MFGLHRAVEFPLRIDPSNRVAVPLAEQPDGLKNDGSGSTSIQDDNSTEHWFPLTPSCVPEFEFYQFNWDSSFDGSAIVRIARHDTEISLQWTKTWEITAPSVRLSQDDWDGFSKALANSDFWVREAAVTDFGFDGAYWTIIGGTNNRSHSIKRWSPRGPIRELGKVFFSLAGKPLADVKLY